jgi:hypothetical protein
MHPDNRDLLGSTSQRHHDKLFSHELNISTEWFVAIDWVAVLFSLTFFLTKGLLL